MIRNTIALMFVALLALTGCASAPDGTTGTAMSAAEIQRELIGKRLGFQGAFSGEGILKRDGTISLTNRGNSYTGTWRFKGDKVCSIYHVDVRGGRETCTNWYRTEKGYYRSSSGYINWVL